MPVFEIQGPDGATYEVDAPDEKTAVQAFQRQMGAQEGGEDPQVPDTGALGASTQGISQGLTFGFGDEIMAGMATPFRAGYRAVTGEDEGKGLGERLSGAYETELEGQRAQLEQAKEEHPVATTVGEVAGGATAGGGLGRGGLSLLNTAKPTVSSMAARGAAEGAAYGAAYGAGTGEGGADRFTRSLYGAGLGAVTGGGMGTGGGLLARRAANKTVPSTEQLKAAKGAAYSDVDEAGVQYSQTAYDDLVDSLQGSMRDSRLNPMRHPRAASMMDDLESLRGTSPSLTELDQLRQVVRRDVANATDDAERYFGNKIIQGIDDFIENAGAQQTVSGSAEDAAQKIMRARELNTRWRKAEMIEDAVERAQRRAQSTGSGGNEDNAIRQNIRRLLDSQKTSRMFTSEEKELLEKVVRGGRIQNLARLVGKLSPEGSGLMTAFGIGATAANPPMAMFPAVGAASKRFADRATPANVQKLLRAVQSGGDQPQPTRLSNPQRTLLEAMMVPAAEQGASLINR